MKTLIATFLLLVLASPSAIAQYRDFTNKDGHAIKAMPLMKAADSVTIRMKDGKEYTIPLSSLSEADTKFISRWSPPQFTFRILPFSKQKNSGSPDLQKDYYFEFGINRVDRLEFSGFQKKEIIEALKEFIRMTEDLVDKQNPEYLVVDMAKINGRFSGSETIWKLIIRGQKLTLYPDGPGRFPDGMHGVTGSPIPLEVAPYLLDYLQKFDADGEARKYNDLETKLKRG